MKQNSTHAASSASALHLLRFESWPARGSNPGSGEPRRAVTCRLCGHPHVRGWVKVEMWEEAPEHVGHSCKRPRRLHTTYKPGAVDGRDLAWRIDPPADRPGQALAPCLPKFAKIHPEIQNFRGRSLEVSCGAANKLKF